jgi:hypothetical protein
MGTQNERLSSDFEQALSDLAYRVILTHKIAQTLNTNTGSFTEIDESQGIDAIVSEINKKDMELAPDKYTLNDRIFRFRSADVDVTSVEIQDEITYDDKTYTIEEITLTDGIYRVIGKRV